MTLEMFHAEVDVRMRRVLLIALILSLMLPAFALADQTVLMTFTGDVVLGGEPDIARDPKSFTSIHKKEGDEYFFANVMDLFKADDLTIINFEGVFQENNNGAVKDKTYLFRAHPDMVSILTASSIEVCNLANNHSRDYNQAGYLRTQQTLTENNIGWYGKKEHFIWEKGNIKIAFMGLNTTEYYDNRAWFRQEIPRLKNEEGVDMVIFTFHVGHEYARLHIKRQAEYAKAAIDAGADLVIEHHPHVIQGTEVYNNRTIFYSLGNCSFGGNFNIGHHFEDPSITALESVIVQAEITFDDDGNYKGQQMKLYPIHTSGTFPQSNYQPVRVTGEDAQRVMELIQNDTPYELSPFDETLGYALQPYVPAE